jgi:uncharacterized protein
MVNKFVFKKIFGVNKPIIGMLHLDYLLGTDEYKGVDFIVSKALKDIKALEEGGINGILIENWMEDSIGPFVTSETATSFAVITRELSKYIHVPFGINVLNNDYKTALSIAALTGASFVQLDVFVDHVKSNFVHSPVASKHPFEIKVDTKDVLNYAENVGLRDIPIFVFIQPKHYVLIDKDKPIERSATEAIEAGASGLIITKATGEAPTIDLIKRAKMVSGDIPVGIGSGFDFENARTFLEVADFAIVGTSIKVGGNTDNPVDPKKVEELMTQVKILQI